MTNTVAYPVVISYDETEKSAYKYLVYLPDFDGYTQGDSLANAIAMARDYIGTYSLGVDELPEPHGVKFTAEHADTVTWVDLDTEAYKTALNTKPVKKTLAIPTYLNEEALKQGVNFSQTLTEALKDKLMMS